MTSLPDIAEAALLAGLLLAFFTTCALAALPPRRCTLCLQIVSRRHTYQHYLDHHHTHLDRQENR